MELGENVAMTPFTTLGLGGAARFLVPVGGESEAVEAARWAAGHRVALHVLGGGSNLVIADSGVDGLVVRTAGRGVEVAGGAGEVLATAAAGEPWDELVARCVAEGWQGIECLSGIPGTVGATPIQNVGAYGQEVADIIRAVRVLDLRTLACRTLPARDCAFSYRHSVFRQQPGRLLVLTVTFALCPGGAPVLRYAELERAVAAGHAAPTLRAVREAVLELRRGKSMLVEPNDPFSRSVGSFFVNPVVDLAIASGVAARAVAGGLVADAQAVPRHDTADGRVKLSAAWLVEKAGFPRGTRRGTVGVSLHHALALVHHGSGTAAELVALARDIRAAVRTRFGIDLQPEPIFWGFPTPDPTA
ncbi:MAG TPA: UDP-N-acetylmuramate dehydrogenase [Thermoanaerobaculaceae bacterium]|nr:UDP-N-acetylmuramate dehydrogenase [Thermoanaerobaculaceae bacterium]